MTGGKTIRRRGFLIGGVALVGGVAFGTYVVQREHPNPLVASLGSGEATFNPWIKVTSDRIVLIAPHADVGQGVSHVQALLIAEEMDLDPGQYDVEFGQPAPAYYNTALAQEGVPYRVTDKSPIASVARAAFSTAGKVIGLQGTGGSTSVTDSYDKLRWAGATARETLKVTAANVYSADVRDLRTERGAVVFPDGHRVRYQDLAAEAAQNALVSPAILRSRDHWKWLGTSHLRGDMVAKSTGTQSYGIDIQLEGMVHAAVRLSPTRSASLRAELSAAETLPGVLKVLSLEQGFAVLADNSWTAMQAAQRIDVDWGPPDYPAEQEQHWEIVENAISDDNLETEWRSDGDGSAFADGQTMTSTYYAPYVAHQPLEPLNATVIVSSEKVEIWAGNQFPPMVQRLVANLAGVKLDQVVFHNQTAGGSFGHRLECDSILQAVEIAIQVPETPVKLTYRREEDFARDFPRHIGSAKCKGATKDGMVTGLDIQISGAAPIASQLDRMGFPLLGADSQLPAGAWNAHYNLQDFRLRTYRAEGLAPVSSWRSVGASSNGFFLESFMDELIVAADADPMEERLRMCSWDVARGVLETVAEMSNWGAPPAAGTGRGLALVESFGVPVAQVIDVRQTEDGLRIDRVWVAVDAGVVLDPVNFENQVQGGVIWGLGHSINSEITYRDGVAEQANYHDAEGLRLYQTPDISVRWRETNTPIRGIGEPPVPPAAPALANAIFRATGKRLRQMPFAKFIDFA